MLLLDEPDNYLDVPAKTWLEERISSSPKTILFVSHDRELLANTATRIVTVELGAAGNRAWTHAGGFATYHEARRDRWRAYHAGPEAERAGMWASAIAETARLCITPGPEVFDGPDICQPNPLREHIGQLLREPNGRPDDLARAVRDRIGEASGPMIELSHSDKRLIRMSLKVVLTLRVPSQHQSL